MATVPSKEERREQILSAALAVFAAKGYHSSGVADILDQAGIARATFYLHFDSKRQVLDELLDDTLAQVEQVLKPLDPTDPGRTVFEQLRDNFVEILTYLYGRPSLARVLLAEAPGVDAEADRKLEAFYDSVVELLIEALEMGQAMGLVRRLDSATVAMCLIGSVKELIYQHLLRDRPPVDVAAVAEQLLGYGLYGILDV